MKIENIKNAFIEWPIITFILVFLFPIAIKGAILGNATLICLLVIVAALVIIFNYYFNQD